MSELRAHYPNIMFPVIKRMFQNFKNFALKNSHLKKYSIIKLLYQISFKSNVNNSPTLLMQIISHENHLNFEISGNLKALWSKNSLKEKKLRLVMLLKRYPNNETSCRVKKKYDFLPKYRYFESSRKKNTKFRTISCMNYR